MREVWLFTIRYPFGAGESFLENELPVLCEKYDRVTIIPMFREGRQRQLPANVKIEIMPDVAFGRPSLSQLIRFGRAALGLWRSLTDDAPPPGALRKVRNELRSRVLQAVYRAAILENALIREKALGNVRLYSYWSHDWALSLALLHAKDPRVRYITRAHGFDLYRHQHASGWIPFQSYLMGHAHRVWAVSTAGLEYLQSSFPNRRELFGLSMLGTTDHGNNPWVPPYPLRIVSCSNMIPRKRVDQWIRVLQYVNVPVVWTHFGDGPDRRLVEEMVTFLRPNIKVDIKGFIENSDLMKWYSENPVHLFVLYSELEGGVAVTAQEAASFGIPILATDSGGVRDIVNASTGLLLPRDPDPAAVADWVNGFAQGTLCTPKARDIIKSYWQEHFDAEKAFADFCSEALDPLVQ